MGNDLRVLYPSLISATLASVLAILLKYPVPLSPLILLSQMSSLWLMKSAEFNFSSKLRLLAVVFLGLPVFAGSVTWLLHRIFLQAFLFSEPESRFRRTLAWSSFMYPISLAVAAAAVLPRVLIFRQNTDFPTVIWYSSIGAVLTGVAAYFAYKFLLKAVVKRKAFLKYPQEYALYLDRADHHERPDLEARGLGPSPQRSPSTSSARQSNDPTPNLLHAKRSEEIFHPLLLIMSVATALSASFIEVVNLFALLRHFNSSLSINRGLLFIGAVVLLTGRLTLSKRVCRFAATGLISELAPSQAYAIQFGVLLTNVVAIYAGLAFISAPVFYWASSIAAIGITKPEPLKLPDQTQPSNKSLQAGRTNAAPLQEESFRKREYGRLIIFWLLLCGVSFASGFIVI